MKLNDKGFAVTSIIYSMLVLFLALVLLIISNLASRKTLFDKEKNEILDKIEANMTLVDMNGNSYKHTDSKYFEVTNGVLSLKSEYYTLGQGPITYADEYKNLTEINIPNKVNGQKVTAIAANSFIAGYATTIRIPEGVTSLDVASLGSNGWYLSGTTTSLGDFVDTLYLPSTITTMGNGYSFLLKEGDIVYVNMKASAAPNWITSNLYWNGGCYNAISCSVPTIIYLPE